MGIRTRAASIAALARLGLTACGAQADKTAAPPAATPAAAPAGAQATGVTAAKFTNKDGSAFSVADVQGKAKVVNFWATWCAPCIGEMPVLNELAKEYESKGVTFVAVSLDEEGPAKVEQFLGTGRVKIDFRQAFAQVDDVKAMNVDFPIPDTVVLDASNRVVAHFDKVVEREELAEAIDKALASS
jgi:thiol-disulfide isomerase/thioredoxin